MDLLLTILWSLFPAPAPFRGPAWVSQRSGTTASLRGVSARSSEVVWASGSNGTFLRTTDGGLTWQAGRVAGAEDLDFRDVESVDDRTAYLLSIGEGARSRVYKSFDRGEHWSLELRNPDPQGFFDAFAFWDAARGILVGDPVDGHFVVLTTQDGGGHWQRRATQPALAGEGAFAASGTCLTVLGARGTESPGKAGEAWFATGGLGAHGFFIPGMVA